MNINHVTAMFAQLAVSVATVRHACGAALWYNHVLGGSISPVPTRVGKEMRRGDEKRSEETKRTKKERDVRDKTRREEKR